MTDVTTPAPSSAQQALFDALAAHLLVEVRPNSRLDNERDLCDLFRAEMRWSGMLLHMLHQAIWQQHGECDEAVILGRLAARMMLMADVK